MDRNRHKQTNEKRGQKCQDAHGQHCEKWESEIDTIVSRLYGLDNQ